MQPSIEIKRELALDAVDRPIFIVGTMRSGTGFLGLQVNRSSEIVGCPFELRKIWTQVGKVSMASSMLGTCCPELDESFLPNVPISALKEAFAIEIEKNIGTKPWSSKLRFLNKNPHLCNKINLVDRLFPQAVFIWTIRDMESVVTSLKNLFEREEIKGKNVSHVWPEAEKNVNARCFNVADSESLDSLISEERCFPGGDIVYLAEYWLESNLSMLNFYQKHGAGRVTLVHQQKVLQQPERVEKQLCDFIGLKSNELDGIAQALKPSVVDKWDSELTDMEVNKLKRFREKHLDSITAINALVSNYSQG